MKAVVFLGKQAGVVSTQRMAITSGPRRSPVFHASISRLRAPLPVERAPSLAAKARACDMPVRIPATDHSSLPTGCPAVFVEEEIVRKFYWMGWICPPEFFDTS